MEISGQYYVAKAPANLIASFSNHRDHAGSPTRVVRAAISLILIAAFALRLGTRIAFGEEYFWQNSYSAYYDLAQNVAAGKGFCFGTTCAWWPPLYPLFLALTTLAGKHYLFMIVPQALMGAGTALCAFLIGRSIFNPSVGIIACVITAFYPYYVMHDTALQETGMVTFWTALSVYLLLRARRSNRPIHWFFAGLALSAIVLTRASLAPSVLLALCWVLWFGAAGKFTQRLQTVSITLLALALAVGPWLIRTYRLTGAPVLSSQTGRALWIGNNPATFSHYPNESIDLSEATAQAQQTTEEHAQLDPLAANEIEQSNWYARRGLAFIKEHPWLTVQSAFRKLWAGFSWTLNPVREPLVQAVYFISYVPVAVLGMIGMFLARRRREVVLIAMLFLAFLCVTSLFWAHTSHRSYLDVYLIIFAASVIEGTWRNRQCQNTTIS